MTKDQEFEEFALARLAHLHRSAWLLCGDRHRAEDLVQETLAKVYVRWHKRLAMPIDNPAAYAQTTLVRVYISAMRRPSAHERPVEVLPDPGVRDGDVELRLALASALEQLQPLDRAVLVLRYLDDRPVREVAATLGCSEGAVRNRTLRALDRLRDVFGPSLTDLLHHRQEAP
ncbi:SigE family RNA polymerase sigma factor [Nocardioides sp. KIGAM211]|uniref:SigE family RNA polymerase sigma factor n=1 Tax=Nocardioides luti TaxID=2761101 RepID=A0A7X0VBC6_9ACTN|nr:SigE family RNA polymerase sigma factor [Nocardioides luti]MBB6628275.1 SigE family RNA polymerase sigma factor [Nocardioides luti]